MREINPDYKYWYTSSCGRIEIKLPGQCIIDCSHQGQCDQDVEYWARELSLDLDPDLIRDDLRERGAWNDHELQDDQTNLERFIWCAACDIREEVRSGDYSYDLTLDRIDGEIYRFTGKTRIDESKCGLDNWRNLELWEVSQISWSDLDPVQGEIEHGMLCIPRVLCGGDYCNSSAVEYANYLEWKDLFAESQGIDWWTIYGDYGSYGIAIRVDTDNQAILDTLAGLRDYPVIDDQRLSEVEMEWTYKAWLSYLAKDFVSAIERDLEIDLDPDYTFDYESTNLSTLFYDLCNRSGHYPEIEAHEMVYVDLDKLMEHFTYADLGIFTE